MANVAPPRTPGPFKLSSSPTVQPHRASAPASSRGDSRFLVVLAAVAYLAAFFWVYVEYLSVVWGYTGLLYRPLSSFQIAFIFSGVAIVAFCLPVRIRAPSSLIVWMLFTFVYMPTMAQTMMLGEKAPEQYMLALSAFTISMAVGGLVSRRMVSLSDRLDDPFGASLVPSQAVIYGLLIVFAATTLALIYVYGSIMNFANITSSEDVYATRFAASDITGGVLGYVRAYYNYVLTPAIMAIGLIIGRFRWFIVLSLVGFIVSYMIDASKISLIIPLAIIGVSAILRYGGGAVAAMTAAMATGTLLFGILAKGASSLSFFADLILFRSIAIPGQQLAQYYDLFSSRGYTFWSNVRGISLFVPPPASFASDPRWPVLGQIVGEEFYGFSSRTNSNANAFAGEGVAAAGPVGVLVIGIAMAIYLRILDRAAIGWDRRLVLYALVPVGFALTNVHLSTTLVSFGGAFWVAFLMFLRPQQTPAVPRRHHPAESWTVRRP